MLAAPCRPSARRFHVSHVVRALGLAAALTAGVSLVASCSPVAPANYFPIQPKWRSWSPGTWSQDQGVDITAPCGTTLVAVASGRIIHEGISGFGPYAPQLLVDSGSLRGRVIYYGHVQRALVPVGAHVRAGQPIAQVGTLGMSYGCHVEMGISAPGSSYIPGWGQTSREMLNILQWTYTH